MGCPSSDSSRGDHNEKGRCGWVLRGQGCFSWGGVTGLCPLSVPWARTMPRSHAASRFRVRCVSWGHFRPGDSAGAEGACLHPRHGNPPPQAAPLFAAVARDDRPRPIASCRLYAITAISARSGSSTASLCHLGPALPRGRCELSSWENDPFALLFLLIFFFF